MNPAPHEGAQPLNLPQDVLKNLIDAMKATEYLWDLIAMDAQCAGAGEQKFKYANLLLSVDNAILHQLSKTAHTHKWMPLRTPESVEQFLEKMNDEEFKEWRDGFMRIIENRDWASRAANLKLPDVRQMDWFREISDATRQRLAGAYEQPFIGDAADAFIDHLTQLKEVENKKVFYAKAVAVVQSSGTGKSRMLSEVGKKIFTLPVCLRGPDDPGYPPSDGPVVEYLEALRRDNDLSITAHIAVVCFVAAAHKKMLEVLKAWACSDSSKLRLRWHNCMESSGNREYRKQFFLDVVEKAKSLESKALAGFMSSTKYGPGSSTNRKDGGDVANPDVRTIAQELYDSIAKQATEDLTAFLSTLNPPQNLCLTYVDEADCLGLCIDILYRLLSSQESSTNMWYTFLGTKTRLSYYAPPPANRVSLRLRQEVAHMPLPYFTLGFDHHMIDKDRKKVAVKMGDLQTVERLCRYGRPLWKSYLPDPKVKGIVKIAAWKLICGETYDPSDTNHVFAVLSQRLCLEPVLAGTEAVKLTERSISHHMRLLTGCSRNGEMWYTYSPSEPMLVLASLHHLYSEAKNNLAPSLETLSKNLCSAGLVEKGLLGELCARTLILFARDFAAPLGADRTRDFLQPVPLLEFLGKLFGHKSWAGDNQAEFDEAFRSAYVNFTHWIVTKDPMPADSSQLLANLWARGAVLQCCFNQEDIDFVIPIYMGSIATHDVFDPSRLSAIAGQVKFKFNAATKAECDAIAAIGLPRDPREPLPYLALLMDLGTEANHQHTNSRVRAIVPESPSDNEFPKLTDKLEEDVKKLRARQSRKPKPKAASIKKLKEEVQKSRQAVDHYNRYFVSARGSSRRVYGILDEANINGDFSMLLHVTAPVPIDQHHILQYMRPFERLGNQSHHTASMLEYDKDAPMEDGSGKAIPDEEGKTEDGDVDMDMLP